MYEKSDRDHVAWDIETTGFGWSEEITVSGFWFPGGHATLIVNAGPHSIDTQAFEQRLSEESGATVSLLVADDEVALLEAMQRVVFDRFDRDYDRLVAFNADSWKGGFALPFVRTRCIRRGVDWMFDGVLFADLWEPLKKRLNTTHTAYGASADANSLTGSYSLLFGQNDRLPMLLDDLDGHAWYHEEPYDPFEDSGSAAAHYREGDLLPVLEHNLADIHRTWGLGELVRRFVSPKDVSEKKLWPSLEPLSPATLRGRNHLLR
jgi:hypothetical protein